MAAALDACGVDAPRTWRPVEHDPDTAAGCCTDRWTPTIIVYGLDQAIAALTAASSLGVRVRLKIAFTVAAALGPAVAFAIIESAREAVAGAKARWVLDCGDDAGLALAAFRAGITEIAVALSEDVRSRVADIGRQLGARLDDHDSEAPVLDLADTTSESRELCQNWLSSLQKCLAHGPKATLPSPDGSCI